MTMTWFPRNVTISSWIGCPSTYCLGDQLFVWGFTDILRCWNTIQIVMKMKNSARSRKMVWIYSRRTISTYIYTQKDNKIFHITIPFTCDIWPGHQYLTTLSSLGSILAAMILRLAVAVFNDWSGHLDMAHCIRLNR